MKMNIKAFVNKKNPYLLFFLTGIIIYIFYSQLYPYRLWKIGEDNLFIFTNDFTKAVLSSPAGLSEWSGLWLSQWYGNVIIGILIHTLLLCSLGIICFYTLMRNGFKGGALGLFALPIAAIIGVSFFAHTPVIIISQIILWASFLLYLITENYSKRIILFLILIPVLFFLLPGGALILLYSVIALREIISEFRSNKSWIFLFLTIIVIIVPLLWNSLFYEPIGIRYSMTTNTDIPDWLCFIVFVPMGLLLFKPSNNKSIPFYWAYIVELVLLIGTCTILKLDDVFHNSEECYHLEYLADNKMWSKIIQRCTDSELGLYDLRLKYSVLSLIELNKLPEALFTLPVTPMFEYTFKSPNSRMTYGFNGRFYQSLNLTNEAMHCWFQDACMSDYGMNFRDLRRLAECSKLNGNENLAMKYRTVLSKSNLSTKELDEFLNKKTEATAQLPQLFISSSESNTFLRILSNHYSTSVINDCLLCNLLIHKDLKSFATMASYCLTSPEQVRCCYKEAALLCYVNKIPCSLEVDDEAFRAYSDLRQMIDNGQSDKIESLFAGSYLKYYFSEMEVEGE